MLRIHRHSWMRCPPPSQIHVTSHAPITMLSRCQTHIFPPYPPLIRLYGRIDSWYQLKSCVQKPLLDRPNIVNENVGVQLPHPCHLAMSSTEVPLSLDTAVFLLYTVLWPVSAADYASLIFPPKLARHVLSRTRRTVRRSQRVVHPCIDVGTL